MQIVAQGAQDKYLTVDPEITFFKTMHRRHTNFACESIQQTLNGTVRANGKVSATISRNGDLVSKMWIEIEIPGKKGVETTDPISNETVVTPATPYEAATLYDLIDSVSVEIGGTKIDKHSGAWMDLYDELHTERAHEKVMQQMFLLPTLKDGESDIPSKLIRIPLSFWFCKDAGQALPLIALQYHEVKINIDFTKLLPTDSQASLWVDYIYLDTDERQRFARSSHEYLIEQVQTTGSETVEGDTGAGKINKIRLNFNHPVKELVWLGFSSSGTRNDGIKSACLQLNGHDRFAKRDGEYFDSVQTFQHHKAIPRHGLSKIRKGTAYVYSFGLQPIELQPSGTCNFSRIDNATLVLSVSVATKSVQVYAVNYNVLRIKNGMGGLAYSN